MTKDEAIKAMFLIRNQLDKLPVNGDLPQGEDKDLSNAYKILYELWDEIEESN